MDRRGFFRSIAALGASVIVPGLARSVPALEAEALLPAATQYVDLVLSEQRFPFESLASVWAKTNGRWVRYAQMVKPNAQCVIRIPLSEEVPTRLDPVGGNCAHLKDGVLVWGAQVEQSPYPGTSYIPTNYLTDSEK